MEIKNLKEFYNILRTNEEIYVLFRKKDKSMRYMTATIDFNKIPDPKKPKETNNKRINEDIKKGYVHVYDLEKEGWRIINYNTLQWVEVKDGKSNIRYRVKN